MYPGSTKFISHMCCLMVQVCCVYPGYNYSQLYYHKAPGDSNVYTGSTIVCVSRVYVFTAILSSGTRDSNVYSESIWVYVFTAIVSS